MDVKKYLAPFLYALTVGYIIFIILSLHRLGDFTDILYQKPFIVSREAGQLQSRLSEISKMLPLYVAQHGVTHEEVYAFLADQEKMQDQALEHIRSKFRGSEQEIDIIEEKLGELRKARRAFVLNNIEDTDLRAIEANYMANVLPHFKALDKLLDKLSAGAENRAQELVQQMSSIRMYSVGLTLFVGIVILLLIFYTRRLEVSRIREIEYRERLFKLLGDNIDEVFIICDAGGALDYVSYNSQRILGVDAASLRHDPERLYAIFSPPVARWLRDLVQSKPSRHPSERDVILGDAQEGVQPGLVGGGLRNFKVRLYPIWGGRKLLRTIIVLYDQTDTIRNQQALNDALQNARSANSAKSSFLSHMSHEIRTPMNAIIGMTTIALSHMRDPHRVEDCLGKIALSSKHLLGLINDILDMAKIEEGKLSINREPFNLQDSLQSLATLVLPQATARKLNFDIRVVDLGVENLVGDSLRLNQILVNLLSNSIKFTPPDGSVCLEVRQIMARHDMVRLQFIISDTGIGMSRETVAKLYRPFEQASASTAAKYGGTGLGMAITQNLVTLLGGTIQVQSEEGRGTTFTVELPFKLAENQNPPAQDELRALKILVVDDDQGTCEHAGLLLDKMGMTVSWTLNGADALRILHTAHDSREDYDICVIDWKMPDMDGKELARRIRAEIGSSSIILILASAYDYSVIEEEARAVGVDAFIAKPFFASSLYNTLFTVTRRVAAAAGSGGQAGQQVTVSGGRGEGQPDGSAATLAAGVAGGPDAGPEPAAAAPGANAGGAGSPQGGMGRYNFAGRRVLLAEDNEFNQEVACEFLGMVGAEVDVAANGREAVDKFMAAAPGTYACILMDVQMPVMNGHEASRAIRACGRPDAGTVPILAMTANAFDEDVTAALAAGMNGHLAKPLDVQAMYRLMEKSMRADEAGTQGDSPSGQASPVEQPSPGEQASRGEGPEAQGAQAGGAPHGPGAA